MLGGDRTVFGGEGKVRVYQYCVWRRGEGKGLSVLCLKQRGEGKGLSVLCWEEWGR